MQHAQTPALHFQSFSCTSQCAFETEQLHPMGCCAENTAYKSGGNVKDNLQIREKPKDTFIHIENMQTLGVTLKEHTISSALFLWNVILLIRTL